MFAVTRGKASDRRKSRLKRARNKFVAIIIVGSNDHVAPFLFIYKQRRYKQFDIILVL